MANVKVATADIRQIAEGLWSELFALELSPLSNPGAGEGRSYFTGCIQLTGAWEGAVVFHCSEPLARMLAAKMLGAEELSDTDICDAVGELTNLLSGSVQSLVPAPSELTPPSVIEGKDYKLVMPRCRPISETGFECMGEPFTVILFDANATESWDSAQNGAQNGASKNYVS
jgi:chemotaxis protein CheX